MTNYNIYASHRQGFFNSVRRGGAVSISTAAFALALAAAPVMLASISENGAPVAQAAITGFQNAPAASTMDINHPVNLTLMVPDPRKFEAQHQENAPRGGNAGYTVTVTKLDVAPINTDEGYKKAAALDPKTLNGVAKGEATSQVTDENGVAKFDGLTPGAYLVTATPPKDSTKYYPQPQDMVIVVPTVGETGTWNYNPVIVAKFLPKDCECTPGTPCVPPSTPPSIPTVPKVPTTTPQPGKPQTPGASTTPNKPNDPSRPDRTSTSKATTPRSTTPGAGSSSSTPRGPLAVTGVQAAGLVGIAAILIGIGFTALTANRKKREKDEQ